MLSSARRKQIRLELARLVEGQSSVEQVQGILRDYLTIDFTEAPAKRGISGSEGIALEDVVDEKIPVESRHVQEMLAKLLDGHITGQDLSDWAAFIVMAQVFEPPGVHEDREAAFDGPVWRILEELAVPNVHGGLDEVVAARYLDRLTADA